MTKEEFKIRIEVALEDSPTYKDCWEIIAEKLWKLKTATFQNKKEHELEIIKENISLCSFLLKIKEKQINRIRVGKNISISIPNGFEQLLEKEIKERGLNRGRKLTIKEATLLALEDETWLEDFFRLQLPKINRGIYLENPEMVEIMEDDKIKNCNNGEELISIINEMTNSNFNNLNEYLVEFKKGLKVLIDKEKKEALEKSSIELFAKTYMASKYGWTITRAITPAFLKKKIKELEKKKNRKSPLSEYAAKRNIALALFRYKGEIPPDFPLKYMCNVSNKNCFPAVFSEDEKIPNSLLEKYGAPDTILVPLVLNKFLLESRVPLKERPRIPSSESKHIYKALRIAEMISEAEVKVKGKRSRTDKALLYAHNKAQKYYLKWDEDRNEIYTPITQSDNTDKS